MNEAPPISTRRTTRGRRSREPTAAWPHSAAAGRRPYTQTTSEIRSTGRPKAGPMTDTEADGIYGHLVNALADCDSCGDALSPREGGRRPRLHRMRRDGRGELADRRGIDSSRDRRQAIAPRAHRRRRKVNPQLGTRAEIERAEYRAPTAAGTNPRANTLTVRPKVQGRRIDFNGRTRSKRTRHAGRTRPPPRSIRSRSRRGDRPRTSNEELDSDRNERGSTPSDAEIPVEPRASPTGPTRNRGIRRRTSEHPGPRTTPITGAPGDGIERATERRRGATGTAAIETTSGVGRRPPPGPTEPATPAPLRHTGERPESANADGRDR